LLTHNALEDAKEQSTIFHKMMRFIYIIYLLTLSKKIIIITTNLFNWLDRTWKYSWHLIHASKEEKEE
jgi:hypothetical protein